jgi:hypothetical protein
VSRSICSSCGTPLTSSLKSRHFCSVRDGGSDPTPFVDAAESLGRRSAVYRQPVCPKCGAEIPKGWPGPGFDHCSECDVPLGRVALTNEILIVNRKARPLTLLQDGLVGSGTAVLAGLLWYALSLPRSALSQAVPQWTLEATAAWLVLWVAGGIVAGVALRINRRELRRRAIDSRVTIAAAQAYFPRRTISRLFRSGRLEAAEPVIPHSTMAGAWPPPLPPSRTTGFVGYDQDRRPHPG